MGKLFNLIIATGTVVISFISDLFSWLSGEMTFKEVLSNLGDNIVNILGEPAKELWDSIKTWFIDTFDSVYVWVHNKFHKNDQIEHSGLWYDNHPEVRAKLLMETAHPKTSPYSTPDYENYTDEDWKKELEKWANRGFGNAKGGVFTSPSLALIGEYSGAVHNPEIITPQNLLDERLMANNKHLLGAINSMTNNIVQAVNDISMDVMIGDETIAKSAGRGNQAWYRKTGKSLLV